MNDKNIATLTEELNAIGKDVTQSEIFNSTWLTNEYDKVIEFREQGYRTHKK